MAEVTEQVKIKMLETCERNVLGADGKGRVRKLLAGTTPTVDRMSADVLKGLGLAVDA